LPKELHGLGLHDLRYAAASLMIALGAHLKAIQERLVGHSSITITMDRYGHLLPSLDDALTDGLDEAFHAATAEPPGEVVELG
jgi:integrase